MKERQLAEMTNERDTAEKLRKKLSTQGGPNTSNYQSRGNLGMDDYRNRSTSPNFQQQPNFVGMRSTHFARAASNSLGRQEEQPVDF